jgi:para-aminobenzoate synthetase component 2
MTASKVLVIDNYDSFVYTLVGYLRELGAETQVIRNDDLPADEVNAIVDSVDGVLLSPGPGNPAGSGVCLDVIRHAEEVSKPLFGVCLGHQALAEAYGGVVAHAEQLMHGKTSVVRHGDHPLFEGVPEPFTATRYHSLAVKPGTVPEQLEVTASTDDGVIMGLAHRTAPLWGIQFHPESVLTQGGYRMLGNWLESLGAAGAARRSAGLSPLIRD